MVRPDLHLPPSFVAWLAPYLAVFSRRSRPTTAALAVARCWRSPALPRDRELASRRGASRIG